MNKSCSKCKNVLPLDSFAPNKRVKSGLSSWCRSCISEYNKSERNKEKARLRSKSHRQRHKDPEKAKRADEIKKVKDGLSSRLSCFKCKEVLSLDAFPKRKGRELGIATTCRACINKGARKQRAEKYKKRISIPGDDCKLRKRRARSIINNLIMLGKLHKKPCEKCGENNVHAHHPNYYEPLEIEWLCSKHHAEKHWS